MIFNKENRLTNSYRFFSLALFFLLASYLFFVAQAQHAIVQDSPKDIPVLAFAAPDLTAIHQEDKERDDLGMAYRFATGIGVNITPQNSGIWKTNDQGDRIWQVAIKYPGAQALSFYFSKFYLYGHSTINVYDRNYQPLHLSYTAKDVLSHGQQNLSLCLGDYMFIELVEPKGSPSSLLEIEGISYAYRGFSKSQEKDFGDSESCEININCSEGLDWQDEKQGVARILLSMGWWGQGWCTGSLVNNTSKDCKPYFLTAMHCIEDMSVTNLNNTRFYFNYESSGCSSPPSQGTLASNYITGCVLLSSSDDVGGNLITQSDFALLFLGPASDSDGSATIAKLKTFGAYWNGWDARNVAPSSGVCIHHPSGDIKKISSFNNAPISDSWSHPNPITHWRVNWSSTQNGRGVTEGGSSGSPLFNYNGGNSHIVGTLSGGASFCSTNGTDLYGKVSYHWTSAGSTISKRLKPFLAPNSDIEVLDGSFDPCSVPVAPTADFIASETSVSVGHTVYFLDISLDYPTNYLWSISPSTGWSYVEGTNSTSQNPRIQFDKLGLYTVGLTVSNNDGENSLIKANYIVVNDLSTAHCEVGSILCDEYIARVELGTLNNSSLCSNYAYYGDEAVILQVGQNYQATITPGIVGYGAGYGYNGDQIGLWIDWNNNGQFSDSGEQIGVLDFDANSAPSFYFSVPKLNNRMYTFVKMRAKIDYTGGGGTIEPCGISDEGETEDYLLVLYNPNGNLSISDHSHLLNQIVVYPNPTQGEIQIDLPTELQQATITIYDLMGKELIQKSINQISNAKIDISNLSSGIYPVIINSEYGQKMHKIIKR